MDAAPHPPGLPIWLTKQLLRDGTCTPLCLLSGCTEKVAPEQILERDVHKETHGLGGELGCKDEFLVSRTVFWNSKQAGGQIRQGFLLRMRQWDLHVREDPLATACWEVFSRRSLNPQVLSGRGEMPSD